MSAPYLVSRENMAYIGDMDFAEFKQLYTNGRLPRPSYHESIFETTGTFCRGVKILYSINIGNITWIEFLYHNRRLLQVFPLTKMILIFDELRVKYNCSAMESGEIIKHDVTRPVKIEDIEMMSIAEFKEHYETGTLPAVKKQSPANGLERTCATSQVRNQTFLEFLTANRSLLKYHSVDEIEIRFTDQVYTWFMLQCPEAEVDFEIIDEDEFMRHAYNSLYPESKEKLVEVCAKLGVKPPSNYSESEKEENDNKEIIACESPKKARFVYDESNDVEIVEDEDVCLTDDEDAPPRKYACIEIEDDDDEEDA